MMNTLKEQKIKYLKFDKFSNWHIIDIISFDDFYWKKIIDIKYIDNDTKTRQIQNCYLTDDWEILSFENKFVVKRIFWIDDILWYKFLWAWISNDLEFYYDFDFKPIIIKWKYLKTLKKLNMKYQWEEYYSINNWVLVLWENELIENLNKYTSFDAWKEIEIEFIN
jgi:hypothetical protein